MTKRTEFRVHWPDIAPQIQALSTDAQLPQAIALLQETLELDAADLRRTDVSHVPDARLVRHVKETERLARLHLRLKEMPAAHQTIRAALAFAAQTGQTVSPWIMLAGLMLERKDTEASAILRDAPELSPIELRHLTQIAVDAGAGAAGEILAHRVLTTQGPTQTFYALLLEARAIHDPDTLLSKIAQDIADGLITRELAPVVRTAARQGAITRAQHAEATALLAQKWPEDAALARRAKALSAPGLELRDDIAPQEQVQQMLDNARRMNPDDAKFETRTRMLERLAASNMYRRVISDPGSAEVAFSPKVEGGDVLLRFAGLAEPGKLHYLDAMAAAAGLNAIYLKDPNRLFFCNGLPSMGGTLDSTIEGLRAKIAEYGEGRKVTVLGSSAGGYAALLYGVLLGADRVISLSGPSTALREVGDTIKDRRVRAILHRLEQHTTPESRDIRLQIERAGYCPQLDLVYGENNRLDRAHAELLADLPQATLHPIKGFDGHNTIAYLTDNGLLLDVLRGDMSGINSVAAART
ncbi:alpha/beta fold hydrolase [Tropicibacter naphthalenivorans]|uniref:Uncharacterized protein n=1 Tax=Tropicibacter naphthalenivorans TaxID=441103 RepID=A0A0P1G9Q1_9RHOB|nr:hypothetical protein [Tropicibacter naphthalenivorans]CUH78262.1 hypothetical protein TRN7648_01883 [Tropicibacter naphthalenivorans]SMC78797.1 hypothetical protein SAMN04488093_10445 [Tropicibacter naphthalenivorans]